MSKKRITWHAVSHLEVNGRDEDKLLVAFVPVSHEYGVAGTRKLGLMLTADELRTYSKGFATLADGMNGSGGRPSAAPEILDAALLCLDANGHLRGCEAGADTDGNDDHCTPHCEALRKAVAKAEGRQP